MSFQLLMLSAMYENGGNLTHRLLDGHPQMFVYPFESQLGTRLVDDHFSSMFPVKYRWPLFALEATPLQDYKAIIDEECKVRARTPHVSKFRHIPFNFSDDDRCDRYCTYADETGRSRAHNVTNFFRATFDTWRDYRRTGAETCYVGYSPIIIIDADKILQDLPSAHLLHVVRNPWSAYADTKKRPVPLSLKDYMLGWTLTQYYALLFREKFPNRVHIVRAEDVMGNSSKTLGTVCASIGCSSAESLKTATFNGIQLSEVYPWGTIRRATLAANRATAAELSEVEREEIRIHAWQYLDILDYKNFI